MSFKDNIIDYIVNGTCSVGSFKWYLLIGDHFKAVPHADEDNRASFVQLVEWIYQIAPMACYGSEKRVNAWINQGGLHGKYGKDVINDWKMRFGINN